MRDRRIQRTRRLLQEALRAMIVTKGYEQTTVQDILDEAGVSRSTFYAHFADKDTLLVSGLNDLRKMLLQQRALAAGDAGPSPARGFGFSPAMLRHAESHQPLYRAMVGKESGSAVMARITAILLEVVAHELEAMGVGRSHPQRDLVVQHVTGSFMGVLTWWLEQGTKLAVEEVDAIFTDLVVDGVGSRLLRPAPAGAGSAAPRPPRTPGLA